MASRKILSYVKEVILGYCCQWLLCIQGWLIQGTISYNVCLPQVVGHKRKPQIDGTYKVRNMHIQGRENLSHFRQLIITSSLLLNNWLLYWMGFAVIFMWFCKQCHSDLSQYSYGFAILFVWILLLVSFRFITIFIWICEKIHMNIMQICHKQLFINDDTRL